LGTPSGLKTRHHRAEPQGVTVSQHRFKADICRPPPQTAHDADAGSVGYGGSLTSGERREALVLNDLRRKPAGQVSWPCGSRCWPGGSAVVRFALGPAISVADLEQVVAISIAVAFQVGAQIQEWLRQAAAFAQQEGYQKAADAAIAIHERMNGLEGVGLESPVAQRVAHNPSRRVGGEILRNRRPFRELGAMIPKYGRGEVYYTSAGKRITIRPSFTPR
jgi:hypothetical protein